MAVDVQKWLDQPDAPRVLLVEVKAYSGGAEVTRYLSTKSQKSFGYYHAVITATPVMEREMSKPFGGAVVPGYGSLDIVNDGSYDSWIYDSWGGREIRYFGGHPNWDRADFVNMFTGKVDKLEVVDDLTLRLHFRDNSHIFDRPLSDEVYTSGEADGAHKPICIGHVFSITPVLITAGSNPVYQIHDGQCDDVCKNLYVNGILNTSIAVTKNNSAGTFTLNSDPSGSVTVDARGVYYAPQAFFPVSSAYIIRFILEEYFNFTVDDWVGDDDWDMATGDNTFNDFKEGEGRWSGVYMDGRTNALELINELAETRLGWFGFTRDGLFYLGIPKDPAGQVPVMDIDQVQGNIKIEIEPAPRFQTTLGYDKKWTKQVSISQSTGSKDFEASDYRKTVYTDTDEAAIKAEHFDAIAGEIEKTLIIDDVVPVANQEAQARQALFGKQRFRIAINTFASGFTLETGDVVTVSDARFKLNKQTFMLSHISDDFYNNTATLRGWF